MEITFDSSYKYIIVSTHNLVSLIARYKDSMADGSLDFIWKNISTAKLSGKGMNDYTIATTLMVLGDSTVFLYKTCGKNLNKSYT